MAGALPIYGDDLDYAPVLAQQGGASGPPAPFIYDVSPLSLRQNVLNLAAKRWADMLYVTGHTRETAEHVYVRAAIAAVYGGLTTERDPRDLQRIFLGGWQQDDISIACDNARRLTTMRWRLADGELVARAQAFPGYGAIVLGDCDGPLFEPQPVARAPARQSAWPTGDRVNGVVDRLPARFRILEEPIDRLFATSPGLHGVLIASPREILFEKYAGFMRPDQLAPSWSMTKAITATLIGRLIHEGFLPQVHAPAPTPLWTDPRSAHAAITIDQLLRMRSGLAFIASDGRGATSTIFEDAFAYHIADDIFDISQRSIVATIPGVVYRYANTGINVLGAMARSAIERRGLPYHATIYALLADRIGMASYQHSADIAGNFVASGSGFATLRDYARLGVLYLNDGVWDGERLLPEGWVDYALHPSHSGSSFAAGFRTNAHLALPDLPRDAAWASGGSVQKILMLRREQLVFVLTSEHSHPVNAAIVNEIVAKLAAAADGKR